ncbi:CHRD domain-containing protein [Paremcibacter congregatus]|nr:CHRD domain-containing protein [Paremcibacter congregatus]
MRKPISFLLGALALLLSHSAHATVIPWTAALDGLQEVPGSGSPATGSATGTLNDITGDFTWNIMWANLTGPAVAMHIHNAPAGINGGVVINVGGISGLTSPSIGATTLNAFLMDEFKANRFYINIHTATHPGGEIRGQVIAAAPVAEPATLGLIGLGLAGLLLGRRRRA